MALETVVLTPEHLAKLIEGAPEPLVSMADMLGRAYFSAGSASYCLLQDGDPVLAGGIVNQQWHRGEAWILPTPFFRSHVKTCFRLMKKMLPQLAVDYGFVRVQAAAVERVSVSLFEHLGFEYEGMLKRFGPGGENCRMYAKIFGEKT
jgi:hypothetical protein